MRAKIAIAALAGLVAACDPAVGEQLVYKLGPKPDALARFDYGERKPSDVQLYTSLKGLTDVQVSTPAGTQLPAGLDKWRRKVADNGGQVLVCDTVISAGGLPIALPGLVEVLGGAAYNLAQEREMYSPAKKFNAIVEYDSSANQLTGVRFVHRDMPIDVPRGDYGECR